MRTASAAVFALILACGQPPAPAPADAPPLLVTPAGHPRAAPLVTVEVPLPPVPPASGDPAAPPGPLPARVRPTATRLDLTVDPRTDAFYGTVVHQVDVSAPVDHLWLNGQGLRVRSVTLTPQGADPIAGTWTLAADPGVARIDLERPAPAGGATLEIRYAAPFDTQLSGLFKVEERGHAFALAKSESIQARKYVPGWDEPRFKVPWSISLTIPNGMVAISNGTVVDTRPTTGDLVRWDFAETPPLPTYLLSLAVGPFEQVQGPSLPATASRPRVPLRGYARPGRGGELARILTLTPSMVAFFEEAFEQPYPYDKLDIVAAPAWPSGATELAAAITYRESRILLDDTAAQGAVRSMESVHAHELAHMWFGNLVTPPWWDDLWLKEGAATWGSTIAREALQPEAGHEIDALAGTLGIMGADVLPATRAVREPIAGNTDIRNAYDGVTYTKGRAVLHMLDAWLGPEVFRPAMGRYVAARADGVADAPDFYAQLARELGRDDVLDVLRSFVEQPGVPLLSVAVSCDGPAVATVSQSPMRALGVPAPPARTWTVPVCLRPAGGQTTCTVLTEESAEIPLGDACPAWVHPNPGGAMYYRASLSPAAWTAVAADLPSLHAVDALPLVSSALAAVDAGERTVADVLPVLDAATQHADRRVVLAALGVAGGWLTLELPDETRQQVETWVGQRAREQLGAAKRSQAADAHLFETALLGILVGRLNDKLQVLELVDRAQHRTGYRGDPLPTALDSDRLGLGLTAAVRTLGRDYADFLRAQLADLDDPRLQPAIIGALGASRDPALAVELRAWALSGELDPRDAWSLVEALLREDETRAGTQRWLLDNLPAFAAVIPSQWRRRVPRLAKPGCDLAFLDAIAARAAARPDLLPGIERPLRQVRGEVERCRVVRAARTPQVVAAFSSPTD